MKERRDDIGIKTKTASLLLIALATLLLSASVVLAQEDTTPKRRLKSPATARGTVGGESHDSYVIRARKGQRMTVSLAWRREGDNQAECTVSESPNFFNATQVGFGKASDKRNRWSGKIPKTRNYYIYVVAHPTATYTVRVAVK